jgi:hypothetical protein
MEGTGDPFFAARQLQQWYRTRRLLVDLFVEAHERAPREIVIDLDNTDIPPRSPWEFSGGTLGVASRGDRRGGGRLLPGQPVAG